MSARVAAAVGGQISSLRKKKEWTQEQLAQHAEMKRSRISLLESGNYEGFSFATLKRIAAAFDVAVIIQFVSFRDFVRWSESFNQAALAPEPFSESDRIVRSEDLSALLRQLGGTSGFPYNQNPIDVPLPPAGSSGGINNSDLARRAPLN